MSFGRSGSLFLARKPKTEMAQHSERHWIRDKMIRILELTDVRDNQLRDFIMFGKNFIYSEHLCLLKIRLKVLFWVGFELLLLKWAAFFRWSFGLISNAQNRDDDNPEDTSHFIGYFQIEPLVTYLFHMNQTQSPDSQWELLILAFLIWNKPNKIG